MVTVTEFWSSCWAMFRTVESREVKAKIASWRTARKTMPLTVLKAGVWRGPAVKGGRRSGRCWTWIWMPATTALTSSLEV